MVKIFRRSIILEMAVIFLLVSTIPLLIYSIESIQVSKDALEEEILTHSQIVSTTIGNNVYHFIEMETRVTRDFGSDGFIRDSLERIENGDAGAAEELSRHLIENKLPLHEEILFINIYDLEGKVVASTYKSEIGKLEADKEYFVMGLEGASACSEEFEFLEKGIIPISAPITSRTSGETIGVIVNFVDLKSLEEMLATAISIGSRDIASEVEENFDFYVATTEGRVVLSVPHEIDKQYIYAPPVVECRERSRGQQGIYRNFEGIEVLGASTCIPELNWVVAVELPKEVAFSKIDNLIREFFKVMVFSIALPGFLIYIGARWITSPLIELSKASEELRKGNFDVRVDIKRKNELGQLGESFNRMVNSLNESVKKYKDLVETSPDAIISIDEKGEIRVWNKAAEVVFGFSKEEALGRDIKELGILEECIDKIMELSPAEIKTGECNGFRKGREIFPIEFSFSKTEINSSVLTTFIIRDVTEKKEILRKLKESEANFRGIIEASSDAIIVVDENEKILIWNPGAEKLFGYKREEVIGKSFDNLIVPEEYRHARSMAFKKAITTKTLAHSGEVIEAEGLRKDGSKFPLEHTVSLLVTDDRVNVISILRDITEKKRIEEELRRKHKELQEAYEELKTLDTLKRDIISNVSHEILTPVTLAKGFIDVAMYEDNLEEIKRYLKHIKKALIRMEHIVSDLVAVAELELEFKPENVVEVDIKKIIDEVIDIKRKMAESQGIEIETEVKVEKVKANEEKLRHVIRNLIDNAIKFNKPNGKVFIKVEKEDSNVKISIRDTGIGIPEDKIDKIFQPLTQLDPSTNRTYSGTGTGLAVVKKIVEAHKGKIEVESKPTEGSTFTITLPQ